MAPTRQLLVQTKRGYPRNRLLEASLDVTPWNTCWLLRAHHDDTLALHDSAQLAHAVRRMQIPFREQDEHDVGTVDALHSATLPEVIDVEEDA